MSDKKSWRDIDRGRDQSAHRKGGGGGGGRTPRLETATAAYKRQLDKLFDGGAELPAHLKEKLAEAGAKTGAGERQIKLRAVHAASGRALTKAIDGFLAEYEMPDDMEFLAKALDHPKDAVLFDVLVKIEAFVDSGQQVPRKTLLRSKLEEVELSSFEPRVQRKAAVLAERLR